MYVSDRFKGFDNILTEGMFLRLITNFINKDNILSLKTGTPVRSLGVYNYHGFSKEFFDFMLNNNYIRKSGSYWYLNPFVCNRTHFFSKSLFIVYNDLMKKYLTKEKYDEYERIFFPPTTSITNKTP